VRALARNGKDRVECCRPVDTITPAGQSHWGGKMAFFELREYRTREGQRDKWIQYMDEVIIPFQVSKGMVIVGSYAGETEEDLWVWIRRFESEEERERLYEAVYQSDEWKTRIGPPIGEMIDRSKIVVRRMVPSPRSIIR
jgi:hypothetical protein